MADKQYGTLKITQPGGAQYNNCEAKRRGATGSPRLPFKGGNAPRKLIPNNEK